MRSYGYQYDDLNRLNNAIYRKPGESIPVSGAYNESLSYDKNGNIKSLQRYGDSDALSVIFKIDDLAYGYLNENSNQLTKVTDSPAGNNSKGFIDGNKTGDDYGYDVNGNMTSDKNKNIINIEYNHLNLPKKITFGTNGTIEYIYNAAGQKLEKIVKDALLTIYTNYLGGFQYSYVENQGNQGGGGDSPIPDDPQDPEPPYGFEPVPVPPVETSRFSGQRGLANNQEVPTRPTLQFFPTAEGYFDNINQKYVFQYKDHLGNVRVSYARNPITNVLEIIDESNYYPFGLKHQGYNTDSKQIGYNYKFLGQERQDELGLNWDTFRHRNYDYAIGRFFGVDPVSEEYMSISTYQFAHNNPVWKIEIEGLEGAPSNGKPDITNHEPVKVLNKPVLGFVGGGLVETKVVQQTTTEVVKEVAKETVKTGSKVIGKVVGTAFALLTDYMSPNYGGRTSEMPSKFAVMYQMCGWLIIRSNICR